MEFLQQLEWLQSPHLVATLFIIATLGALVQFGMGMGFGIVASPIMALIDPMLVPIPPLVMGLITSCAAAISCRNDIEWYQVRTFAAGRLISAVIASYVLVSLTDEKHFLLFFGGMILVALGLNLTGWSIPFNRWTLFATSNLSGFMATITSVGAPPVALLYSNRPAESRGTIGAFFALGSFFSLLVLFLSGWAGWAELTLTVLLIPPMLVGMLLAKLLKNHIDTRFRSILLVLSAIASVTLIYSGLS